MSKEKFRSIEPRSIEFNQEPLRMVNESSIIHNKIDKKKRIKYIEEILSKDPKKSPSKFNPYTQNVKPIH